jgi:hypothetical protein
MEVEAAMATYGLDINSILDWTPSQLNTLSQARNLRDRGDKIWQIKLARIPGLAEPVEYIRDLLDELLPWEDQVAASGAPRLDEMSEVELQNFGVKIVKVEGPAE